MIIKIYKITNSIDRQIYVGSTTQSLRRRFRGHKQDCKKIINQCKLYQLMREYGIECFKIELIEETKIDGEENNKERFYLEAYWINQLNADLNKNHPEGYICQHGRKRGICKECGGSQICKHGRRRSLCKECCGGHICNHGRQRSKCKKCRGISCIFCKITTSIGHWKRHCKSKKHQQNIMYLNLS